MMVRFEQIGAQRPGIVERIMGDGAIGCGAEARRPDEMETKGMDIGHLARAVVSNMQMPNIFGQSARRLGSDLAEIIG